MENIGANRYQPKIQKSVFQHLPRIQGQIKGRTYVLKYNPLFSFIVEIAIIGRDVIFSKCSDALKLLEILHHQKMFYPINS